MHDELIEAAVAAAKAGGAVLERYFGDASLEVFQKGTNDFVTRADRESEEAVVGLLGERFPDHHVLAEEGGARVGGDNEHLWIIDPLDGTTNFTQGLPIFCVSIACRRGKETLAGVVYSPLGNDWFVASRGGGAFRNGRRMRVSNRSRLQGAFLATGYPYRAHTALDPYLAAFREAFLAARAIRRCGSAALDLANTAAGVYDGFFEYRLSPWDIAAGALLVTEAGGVITDLDGGEGYLSSGNVIAGAPGVQQELRRAVARHADEGTLLRLIPADPLGPVLS